MTPEKREKSCGAVLCADTPAGRRYVLVQGPDGFWGFPKGHMEAGETEREAALREILEETGAEAVLLDGFRSTEEYALEREGHPEIIKQVVFFLARAVDLSFQPRDTVEIRAVRLMDYGGALAAICYEDSRRILAEAEQFLNASDQI